MSIAMLNRIEALERLAREQGQRIADLEARSTHAPTQGNRLPEYNAARQANAERLRAQIARTLDGHPRAAELTAKQVRNALEHARFQPLPAERTVRLYLEKMRGNGNTASCRWSK
jgi:hypothetical protein